MFERRRRLHQIHDTPGSASSCIRAPTIPHWYVLQDGYSSRRSGGWGVTDVSRLGFCCDHPVTAAGEELRKLYPAVLKRLDDSVDAIRISACDTLHLLLRMATPEEARGGPHEYTLEALLVHIDDPNTDLQKAASAAVEGIIAIDPDTSRRKLEDALHTNRCVALCEKLLALATAGSQ